MNEKVVWKFSDDLFPVPDSAKAKTPKTNQSSVFFNRVASQTPGTGSSEWAAGFRPWPVVPNDHAGRPAVRDWHYNCFTGKLKHAGVQGRLKILFAVKLSTISAFLKIIPIETFFAFDVEKHRNLNYINTFYQVVWLARKSFYSGLTLNQYGVASPCRTICTVCSFVALFWFKFNPL